jgi:hypothetical protein
MFLVQWKPSVPELKKPCMKWKSPIASTPKNNTLLGVGSKGDIERMLTMEQVYRIRNMRKFEGKNLRKISQLTGHDFETVKKYIEQDDFNHIIRPKQRRQGKLFPCRSIVTTWLISDKQAPHKHQHTEKRVYNRLKEL